MRQRSHILAVFFGGLLMFSPGKAFAEVFLTPFAGVTFMDSEQRRGTFGASIGIGSVVGVEFEGARTLFGSYTGIPVVDLNARVSTMMGNVMVRLPHGTVQPYASVGGGLVRLTGSVDVPFLGSVVSASADDFGWNFGGGVMFFPSSRIGVRADLRRFQSGSLDWDEVTSIGGFNDLPLPKVNFWRATAGLTFRF